MALLNAWISLRCQLRSDKAETADKHFLRGEFTLYTSCKDEAKYAQDWHTDFYMTNSEAKIGRKCEIFLTSKINLNQPNPIALYLLYLCKCISLHFDLTAECCI